jgi:hypothetical protein
MIKLTAKKLPKELNRIIKQQSTCGYAILTAAVRPAEMLGELLMRIDFSVAGYIIKTETYRAVTG